MSQRNQNSAHTALCPSVPRIPHIPLYVPAHPEFRTYRFICPSTRKCRRYRTMSSQRPQMPQIPPYGLVPQNAADTAVCRSRSVSCSHRRDRHSVASTEQPRPSSFVKGLAFLQLFPPYSVDSVCGKYSFHMHSTA